LPSDNGLPEKYTPSLLDSMSANDLIGLRDKYSGNMVVQKDLAPYEHQAFSREYVKDNPLYALAFSALGPGYQAAKSLGMLPVDKDTTPASLSELMGGFKGIAQGLGIP
jgi:hypothetical protein